MSAPQRIYLEGFTFEKLIEYSAIQKQIASIAHILNDQYPHQEPILMPVLTGAFRFFAELLPHIKFPYLVDFIKISSYKGQAKEQALKWELLPSLEIKNKCVILIEDIIDTGKTLEFLLQEYILAKGPKSVKVVTLLHKPHNNQSSIKPDIVGFTIPPEFVVGFGLDLNQKGRSLNDLYICRS
ncbi:MAG: phosphoribosyltransferase family protein [Bacteroidia bacterium]|nr:phosphoribosyltransferase family protein [Bacteroidia bacterium]MDW8159064.1 phosphoribosyltransferase family protein [Bacteroidia bacterium]